MIATDTAQWLNVLPAQARAAWLRWQQARRDCNRGHSDPMTVYELRQAYFAVLELP